MTLGFYSPETVAESAYGFHKELVVNPSQPVVLEIVLSNGNIRVLYSHDGEVAITAEGLGPIGDRLDASYFKAAFLVEQDGNRIQVHSVPNQESLQSKSRINYRIDVPYRTEVTSRVDRGSQSFTGVMGPVKAEGGSGDIKASYLSKGLQVEVGSGNLEFEVIGEHAAAKTGSGNISAIRMTQGVDAESGDGDITLTVVGPSTAAITRGTGRIEVAGARGSFDGSTQAGDLHMKAELHGDWRLRSISGTIRMELPPAQKADLDAATDTGAIQLDRDDIAHPQQDTRHFMQKLNGGGPRIEARTGSGRILLR